MNNNLHIMDEKTGLRFDGGGDFGRFRTKMLAFGALKKGCNKAFLNDLDISPGCTDEAANLEMRQDAWSYLMIALDGPALQLVNNISPQNPYVAWNMLVQRYDPADVEAYARLNQEFSQSQMDDPYDCPDEWVGRMIKLNGKMMKIKAEYGLDDMQMISSVINKLPKHLYSMFISNYNLNGYTIISLHVFQNKLCDFWLSNV